MILLLNVLILCRFSEAQITSNNACNGTEHVVEGTEGTISSPNYPNNYEDLTNCLWKIQAPNMTRIAIRFEPLFAIEPSLFGCIYDRLIFTEPSESSETYCGTTAPTSFLSESNVLTVNFVSDFSITMTGFSLNWTAIDVSTIPDPVVTTLSSDRGQISSPGYPTNYGNFLNYTWKVNGTAGKNILLEFESLFEVGQVSECIHDRLVISEGNEPPSPFSSNQVILCGLTLTKSRRLFVTNEIFVRFTTDNTGSGRGFSFNFTAIDPPRCDAVSMLNASSGIISTPLYPATFLPGQDCIWYVVTPADTVIAVRFSNSFSIPLTTECRRDYLQVFDGPSTNSTQFLHDFCGSYAPRSFVTTGNAVTVRFHSDSFSITTGMDGFQISWTAEKKCQTNEFTCWDGTCIPNSAKCNGTFDCPNDQSDEVSCPPISTAKCGQSEIPPSFKWHHRIAGGYPAEPNSWPFQIYLNITLSGTDYFLCGGSIIGNSWILIAAHCIIKGFEAYTIVAGAHNRFVPNPEVEQKVLCDRFFVHPQFNASAFTHDIALCHLSTPLNFTKWVQPICLPTSEPKVGENLVATGWGWLNFITHAQPSATLQQVVFPVVSHEHCDSFYPFPLSDSVLCAGYPQGGESTCRGDSGGPAMKLENGSWVVSGVTSFGIACGLTPAPSGYANVFELLPYIKNVMENVAAEIRPDVHIIRAEQSSGVITSPNYGVGHYPQGLHIMWYFVPTEGKVITIDFNSPYGIEQVPYNHACSGDYLKIYYGSDTTARKYGDKVHCGNAPPLNFESDTAGIIIEFKTDYSFEDIGFSINWKFIDGCSSDQFRCWNQSCVSETSKCNSIQDCPNNEDEFECVLGTPGSTECGRQEVALKFPFMNPAETYVVNGHNVEPGSVPWQVALYRETTDGKFRFTCGGSLIDKYWVLTAAHCLSGSSKYQVSVGDHNISDSSITAHERRINVVAVISHPQYGNINLANDIGLLRLESPVDFTSKWYKPICLPSKDRPTPPVNSTCIVSGWGVTGGSRDHNVPDIMQQLQVKILNDSVCQTVTESNDGVICAGYVNFEAATCFGDSGGPLFCLNNGSWVQYGITSFHISHCGYRSFYEKVAPHLDAINDIITNYRTCQKLTIAEGSDGTIVPPTAFGRYSNEIDCSWLIRGPPNTVIVVRFEFFDTESCSSFFYDYINIYDGNSTSARQVFDETLCGRLRSIRGFESSTNEVLITFITDFSVTAAGFKITWEAVADCSAEQFRCWNGSCIEKSLQCDGKSDCADSSDEKECAISGNECGKQDVIPDFLHHARIAGGHYAKNGSWPFMVQIVSADEFKCAGTIINEGWVLTSAECVAVANSVGGVFSVVVDELKTPPASSSIKYAVAEYHFQDEFYSGNLKTVALLKLAKNLSFSSNVQPCCIAIENIIKEPEAPETCVILGWGATVNSGRTTGNLRQGIVPILPDETCTKTLPNFNSTKSFCGGSANSASAGACYKDEGGPVMCFRGSAWVQSGIITTNRACDVLTAVDQYTRVSSYTNWIQQTMNRTLPVHVATDAATTAMSTPISTTATTITTSTGPTTTAISSTTSMIDQTATTIATSTLSQTVAATSTPLSSTTSRATCIHQSTLWIFTGICIMISKILKG